MINRVGADAFTPADAELAEALASQAARFSQKPPCSLPSSVSHITIRRSSIMKAYWTKPFSSTGVVGKAWRKAGRASWLPTPKWSGICDSARISFSAAYSSGWP